MPEYIHTIPVLEALRNPGHCAFCAMRDRIDTHAIQFIMGPAYMEDDVRMETNRMGFCETHLTAMYAEQNRLGLALMLHTHMQELNKNLTTIVKSRLPAPLFGKDASGPMAKIQAHLTSTLADCYVCRHVERNFTLYMGTFLHLWQKGGEDAQLIKAQKGYCIPHFTRLLSTANEKFGRGKREKFIDEVVTPQLKILRTLEEDLEWFTQKFDHRNADAPWKNSKDALPRALAMFGSKGAQL